TIGGGPAPSQEATTRGATPFQVNGPAAKAGGEKWQTPNPVNARGATTGPTDAPGYDHPNQYMVTKPTEIAPNMEPVIVHPKQVKEAAEKLAKAHAKHGKRPNFLVFLMDDVGWMDPGFNGGGCT